MISRLSASHFVSSLHLTSSPLCISLHLLSERLNPTPCFAFHFNVLLSLLSVHLTTYIYIYTFICIHTLTPLSASHFISSHSTAPATPLSASLFISSRSSLYLSSRLHSPFPCVSLLTLQKQLEHLATARPRQAPLPLALPPVPHLKPAFAPHPPPPLPARQQCL